MIRGARARGIRPSTLSKSNVTKPSTQRWNSVQSTLPRTSLESAYDPLASLPPGGFLKDPRDVFIIPKSLAKQLKSSQDTASIGRHTVADTALSSILAEQKPSRYTYPTKNVSDLSSSQSTLDGTSSRPTLKSQPTIVSRDTDVSSTNTITYNDVESLMSSIEDDLPPPPLIMPNLNPNDPEAIRFFEERIEAECKRRGLVWDRSILQTAKDGKITVTLIKLRHGRAEHNEPGGYGDKTDTPLVEAGTFQAQSTCDQMVTAIEHGRLEVPDAIAITVLGRGEETIQPLIDRLGKHCESTNSRMPIIFRTHHLRETVHAGISGGQGPCHINTDRKSKYPVLGASGLEHLPEPCMNIHGETEEEAIERGFAQRDFEARSGAMLAQLLGKKHVTIIQSAHGENNHHSHNAAMGTTGWDDPDSGFQNAMSKGYTYTVNTRGNISDGTGDNFHTDIESVARDHRWDFKPDPEYMKMNGYHKSGMTLEAHTQRARLFAELLAAEQSRSSRRTKTMATETDSFGRVPRR